MADNTEQNGTKIKVFFTADTHFTHPSTLYFHPERRIAADISLEELQADKMKAIYKFDEWLINRWNETVGRQDFVYILGDFCLGNKARTEEILSKLHGRKYLIRGNHDKSAKGLERYFQWVGDIKEAKFNHNQYKFINPDEPFCLEMCHYPLLTWNRRPHGTCHIHGHCHNSITQFNTFSKELRLDVGIDSDIANLGLVTLEDIYNHMRKIVLANGCTTFEEHTEKLMLEHGFRM